MEEQREWQRRLEHAGIDPRGIDGSEEINEACRLLSIDGLAAKSRFRVFLKRLSEPCFQVSATIEDARLSKGVRAAMYKKADDNSAHCVLEEKPIVYGEGDDVNKLFIKLYFITNETAMAFSRALRMWSFDHPNSSVHPKVSLPVECIRPLNLQPVTFDQYDPAEAEDSPCTSLADFRVRPFIKQQQARSSDKPPIADEDIKQLAAFARQAMESNTDKRDMSKASSQWAQELVAALGIVVKTEDVNKDVVVETAEPPGYLWPVTTTAGDTVKISEHQGTPGARNWFCDHFLSGDDLEKKGYTCEVVAGHLLPRLKAGGKGCSGKGDMVIGEKTSIDFADSVYEQAPGLIELKTDEYPIKVGQIILELTAFSKVSRFGRGVVLLASDCNTKWRLAWFQDYNTICRRNYVSGRKCWVDFKEMLLNAVGRGMAKGPPQKKELVALNEDQGKETDDDQNLEGFEESDVKQKAVDDEALLHQLANYLGDLYGERPVVPDWAKAKSIVPDYYA